MLAPPSRPFRRPSGAPSLIAAVMALLAFLLTLATSVMTAPAAHADGVELVVTVTDEQGDPVPGVGLTLADDSGALLEETSGEDGTASFDLTSSGGYDLYFDASTLPDGVGPVDNPTTRATSGSISPQFSRVQLVADGDRSEVTPTPRDAAATETADDATSSSGAATGGDSTTPADDGSGSADGAATPADPAATADVPGLSFWQRLFPKIATGLTFGLLLGLASIGLSLIYGTTRLNNFSHGELVTFGGFAAYFFAAQLGQNGWIAILGSLVLGGAFGWLQDTVLWKPLRRRRVGVMQLMIVSIGLALTLRYVYAFLWGPDRISIPADNSSFLTLGTVNLRYWDAMGSVIAIVLIVAVALFLTRTNLGKATRAVADNKALAAASGIDVERVTRLVWIGAGSLAGVAGALIGYYQTLQWNGGALILLMLFAAVTLGGLGTTWGALVGAIIVGLAMDVSTMWVPTSLKYVVAMLIMIVILLVRPQGILGSKQRIG